MMVVIIYFCRCLGILIFWEVEGLLMEIYGLFLVVLSVGVVFVYDRRIMIEKENLGYFFLYK